MTSLTAGASFTESSWRWPTDFSESGTGERDPRDERGGPLCRGDRRGPGSRRNTCGRYPQPSQGQDLNWPEGMRPIPGPGGHRSCNPHTGYVGRRTSDVRGAGKLRGTAQGGQGERPWRWCSIPESCESPRRRGRQPGAGHAVRDGQGNRRRWTGAARPALTGTDASAASGCSFRVFVLGVRDDPGLVPDLIRELVRQAAADAALDSDARKIPGTEAAWPRRRACHSGSLSGQNGVLAPWVNSGTLRA